jgi:hypothetical protein
LLLLFLELLFLILGQLFSFSICNSSFISTILFGWCIILSAVISSRGFWLGLGFFYWSNFVLNGMIFEGNSLVIQLIEEREWS